MAHRCVLCFGATESDSKACERLLAYRRIRSALLRELDFARLRESARRPAHVWLVAVIDFLFLDRQFAVAARRLRSGEAGLHVLRDDQGRTLVLSAHATGTRGNKAAARRLDFCWPFFFNAFMGRGMASTVASGGDRDLDSAVPR